MLRGFGTSGAMATTDRPLQDGLANRMVVRQLSAVIRQRWLRMCKVSSPVVNVCERIKCRRRLVESKRSRIRDSGNLP